jgi:hypothetical protein
MKTHSGQFLNTLGSDIDENMTRSNIRADNHEIAADGHSRRPEEIEALSPKKTKRQTQLNNQGSTFGA